MTLISTNGVFDVNNTPSSIFGGEQVSSLSLFGCWVYFDQIPVNTNVEIKTKVFDINKGFIKIYKKTIASDIILTNEPAMFFPFVPSTKYDITMELKSTGTDFEVSWNLLRQPQT